MHSAQRSLRAALQRQSHGGPTAPQMRCVLQQGLDGPAAPQLCCMMALAVPAPKTAAAEMREATAGWVA